MKSRKQFIRKTLAAARSLQVDYDILGAPSTQNVRNPVPLWALVQQALPKKNVLATVRITATINGKRRSFAYKANVPTEKFGADLPNGFTIEEVVQSIRDHGFIAHKGSVAGALATLKSKGLVESTRHNRPALTKSRRNVSFCRYVMR